MHPHHRSTTFQSHLERDRIDQDGGSGPAFQNRRKASGTRTQPFALSTLNSGFALLFLEDDSDLARDFGERGSLSLARRHDWSISPIGIEPIRIIDRQ